MKRYYLVSVNIDIDKDNKPTEREIMRNVREVIGGHSILSGTTYHQAKVIRDLSPEYARCIKGSKL